MRKQISKTNQPLIAEPPHGHDCWNLRCGGRGICSSCRVTLLQGVFNVAGKTVDVRLGMPLQANACQTTLLSDTGLIDIPESAVLAHGGNIANEWQAAPLPANGRPVAAVDLGTTTVVAVRIENGLVVRTASAFNLQGQYGDNVISRITHSGSPEGLAQLQKAAAKTIDSLFAQWPDNADIQELGLAGNTTMTCLLWGIDCTSIGVSPFTPPLRVFPVKTASELGISALPPDTPVHAMPSISAYVGGDLTAGLHETELQPGEALVDIGTNCEIILRTASGEHVCTAAAAGPAFEGAGIACGRRAVPGAIDHILPGWKYTTIGNDSPNGLCGSAMLDFMAVGNQEGWLSSFGRLEKDEISDRIREIDGITAAEIAPNVTLTEKDLEQLLKAKAAVFAGIQSLLESQNMSFSDLKKLHLAGGFAKYMDLKSAVAIGMLPDVPFNIVGNTSLAGASRLAAAPSMMDEFIRLSDLPREIPLNDIPSFEDNYIDALMLP